jgi:hypothetical protein
MPEAAVHETTVAAVVQANAEIDAAKEAKQPRITVVTPDNFDQYVSEKLPAPEIDPEAKGAEELAAIEAKNEEIDHPDEKKKGKLNERFSELTKARKEAEAKAEAARNEAKAAREAAEQAAREAAALKAKYEPVKTEPDPEPQPGQFADVNEYSKALKDWTADQTRREDAAKAEQVRARQEAEKVGQAWQERQKAVKAEIEDYETTIAESAVKVSDQVRDAIVESDVGPQILYHLAKNPEVADRIAGMTVGRALREIGKIEASLEGSKETKAEAKVAVAEVSKAPPPINPLKGANAPVVRLSGSDEVPKNLSYEQWKKLRQSGKIQ